MKAKHKRQWEKIRSIGKWRTILLFALFWGTSMTIGRIVGEYFFGSQSYGLPSPVFWFVSNFIVGLILAPIWWNIYEGRYNRSKKD